MKRSNTAEVAVPQRQFGRVHSTGTRRNGNMYVESNLLRQAKDFSLNTHQFSTNLMDNQSFAR